jgi:hypothetical protein
MGRFAWGIFTMVYWRGLMTAALISLGPPGSVLAFAQGIWVEAATDCGNWVKARARNTPNVHEALLLGTLNGMALGTGIDFWRAGGTKVSREQVFLWMDKYCRENPLSHIIDGSKKLIDERSDNGWTRAKEHLR